MKFKIMKLKKNMLFQEEELKEAINKDKRFRLKGRGKKLAELSIKPQLFSFKEKSLGLGIGITTNEIIIKDIELEPKLKNKFYKTLSKWLYLFLKRNKYTIRIVTYIGQKLKNESFEQLMIFLKINIQLRKELQIIEHLDCIGKVDEIPIFLK